MTLHKSHLLTQFVTPYRTCVLWFCFVLVFGFYVHISPIICIWGLLKFVFNSRSLGVIITSVVPGDYDGDSQMDVLLTTRTQNHGKDELSVFIFWGHNQTLGESWDLLTRFLDFLVTPSIFRKLCHVTFMLKVMISSCVASYPCSILLLNTI